MINLHEMTLNSPWFELMKQGIKKYEGRRNTAKVQQICVGDTIEFRHHTDITREPFRVEVTYIHRFPTFRDALLTLPISDVLPNDTGNPYSLDEADLIYQRYVSKTTQQTDGVVMLEVNVVHM